MAKEKSKNIELNKIEIIQQKLDEVNKLIEPYKLAYVSINDCELLKRNARYMEKDTFEKLTSNIKYDGFLSQLPFAMKRKDGKYLILSGNHRVKAAIKAGLSYILILYTEEMSKDKQIAYQLSHNSLTGKDDLAILKEIFQQIENLDMKEFSGLNDFNFMDVQKISIPSINEDDIELHEIKFLFTKSKKGEIEKLLETLEKLNIDENTKYVFADFSEFIRLLSEIKRLKNIKSNTVAFVKIMNICEDYIKEQEVNNGKIEV